MIILEHEFPVRDQLGCTALYVWSITHTRACLNVCKCAAERVCFCVCAYKNGTKTLLFPMGQCVDCIFVFQVMHIFSLQTPVSHVHI